jgi:hypothetical protein
MMKLFLALAALLATSPAWAIGTFIAASILGAAAAGTFAFTAIAFAVNLVVSTIISKTLRPDVPDASGNSPNPGNRQQIPPATDNKIPVVYGEAWLGGTVVDLSITSDNQTLYYVIALAEVTSTNTGQTPDTISFGNIYYGGKLVAFAGDGYTVASLTDESTGEVNTEVAGLISIYLYSNGSTQPANSALSAIQLMQSPGLTYQWTAEKVMSNCAFAIVKLKYNAEAGITGIQQTKFKVINSRYRPGDCFYDYLINTRYGAAIPLAQINTASLTTLNNYCDQSFTYTTYAGFSVTQTRFRFDGVLDTNQSIMNNLQSMASCCDCLIRYNEIYAQWGVITQTPSYSVAMALNDSNIISAIQITPIDLASSFNVIEVKFPDKNNQDAFNSATFDLAAIDPSLLFQNEPVNKESISLPLVNNDVRAQYLANRFLKAAREDLQIECAIGFPGLQLEAGDVVTITNVNYGWAAKLFRCTKVTESFGDDGLIAVKLLLQEYNPSIFDDVSITQFSPSPNTGIGDPIFFGTIYAPVVVAEYPTIANPLFTVQVTTSSSGITQYAEVWYSAFSTPTSDQLIFAATSEIQSSGTPWSTSTALPIISLTNIPAGNWYFFCRMVNSLGASKFSSASAILRWRPTTFQFTDRYVAVAYGDSNTGSNFSLNPRNRLYYGLRNQSTTTPSVVASDYTWYLANPAFGSSYYLCYSNRTGRKFSFDTGLANYAAGSGAFVPTQTAIFDPTIWSALVDGTNIIDLDKATGQVLKTGTSTVGSNTGEINVVNTVDGRVIGSLKQFLDFGGANTITSSVATLTVDIYGRVVGFEVPDSFYFTKQSFTATSGQTVFSVTRAAGYISGQCLVLQNGLLLDTSEYTDTGGSTGTVTLSVGATLNDIITIISFKSSNASTGVYASFTRNTANLTNASEYTASGFTLVSGYELLFLNGTVVNEQDYNIVDQTITDFPNTTTGKLTIIQWSANNLTVPNGDPVNVIANTVIGQTTYSFAYDVNAFNLYNNGVLLLQGTDYTTATNTYALANSPTTALNLLLQQTFSRTGAV